jgi:hypothetical protein
VPSDPSANLRYIQQGKRLWAALLDLPGMAESPRAVLDALRASPRDSSAAYTIVARLTHTADYPDRNHSCKQWEGSIAQCDYQRNYRVVHIEGHIGGMRHLVVLDIFKKNGPDTPSENVKRIHARAQIVRRMFDSDSGGHQR